jgi:hypothetical protein
MGATVLRDDFLLVVWLRYAELDTHNNKQKYPSSLQTATSLTR